MRSTQRFLVGGCFAAASLAFCGICSADVLGFSMRITPYRGSGTNANNLGFPYVDLTNTSTTADITDYQLTIGNTNYFWDASLVNASSQISSASANLVTPGTTLDNEGGNLIHYTFADGVFTPGLTFSHRNDIDAVSETGMVEDYTVNQPDFREVLFDISGSAPVTNAVVTVTYNNGQTLSAPVPNFTTVTSNNFYTFTASATASAAPEPASLAIFGAGALAMLRRRRRK